MHQDIQDLQVKLKEILYDCATEVKATKAALYLRESGGANRFELVTEGEDANRDLLRFVFHTYDPDLDKLEPKSTLERALVARMRAGEQWRSPRGVTSLA